MNEFWLIALTYVVGGVPFGWIIGKIWGAVDVRRVGSGNIGTSNVLRSVGKGAAAVVLLFDVAKGTVPVLAAQAWDFSPWGLTGVALAAVAGHVWSVFLRFQGGKGIATTLGVAIGLDWRLAAALVFVWLAALVATRYISVASLTAAAFLPLIFWGLGASPELVAGGVAISAIAFWRHKSNIHRLRTGKEYRFGEKARGVER